MAAATRLSLTVPEAPLMATITPLQYAKNYWDMQVPMSTTRPKLKEWVTVRVDSYRLKADEAGDERLHVQGPAAPGPEGRQEEGQREPDRLHQDVTGNRRHQTFADRFAFAEDAKDPFYGNGCPEEVQVTLRLAIRFGVIQPTKEAIQAYCNTDHLGLDCDGFIGNYIRHGLQKAPWHVDPAKTDRSIQANSAINAIMAHCTPVSRWRKSCEPRTGATSWPLADAGTGRIRDYADSPVGHIMITEPGPITGRGKCGPAGSGAWATTTSWRCELSKRRENPGWRRA